MPRPGFVYIMASCRNGTIYIGVTSDLVKRAWEHKTGDVPGFTCRYDCKLLVWFAVFADIQEARAYELGMKKWNRAWKLRAIEEKNPQWNDLYPAIVQ